MTAPIEIIETPLSVAKFDIGGFQDTALLRETELGLFQLTVGGYGTAAESSPVLRPKNFLPKVQQAPINIVKGFTLQAMPAMNPLLLICFSDNPAPVPSNSLNFIFTCSYEVGFGAGAAFPASYDPSSKFWGGNPDGSMHELPGNYNYFRLFAYKMGEGVNFNNEGNVLGFDDTVTAPRNPNTRRAFACVKVYGR